MSHSAKLARQLGLLGLTATGVCAMVGAGINVIPFMIQRSVPGVGPYVLPAFALATLPVLLAALAYAVLASAMPRAGGTYVYASRGLHPYLGFVASFSQWFALCVAIGVVSYVLVPFLRDIAVTAGWQNAADVLERGPVRLTISLAVLWIAIGVNLRGITLYERLVVPLMFLTFALGAIVIVAGFAFDHADFAAALAAREGRSIPDVTSATFSVRTLLTASAVLFASFIGFDAIAQAGGEAANPGRDLPLSIALAVGSVAIFYMLFTAAVYHAVPWSYVAAEALERDLTAPGLLGYLLPPFWTVMIVSAAAIALIKDLPPMLLSVSRLMFAWAEDGIFPSAVAAVHPTFRTPHIAILASGAMATLGVIGSHLAGDFLPRRGHSGNRHAGELPADGGNCPDAAATQPVAGPLDHGAAVAPRAGSARGDRRHRAGPVSGRAHGERSHRSGRRVVLPLDIPVGRGVGRRLGRLLARGPRAEAARR